MRVAISGQDCSVEFYGGVIIIQAGKDTIRAEGNTARELLRVLEIFMMAWREVD